ncbi:MAG: DUF1801 domain-containing protein [Paracoccaceae bacterium]|nr:DUF1801 domain-containing protein [Paracoccaceae bacterium]
MATTLKTAENDGDVAAYLDSVENPRRRDEAWTVLRMMEAVTGETPRMWGDSIVGFGRYRYRRSDRSEHDWMLTGFAPRKSAMTIYIMPGFSAYGDLLERLGRHRHSVSCLYVTRLGSIDFDILTELVRRSVADMRQRYSV